MMTASNAKQPETIQPILGQSSVMPLDEKSRAGS